MISLTQYYSLLHTVCSYMNHIFIVSRYTTHDAHQYPGSFTAVYDLHTVNDMMPQHHVNITKLITECF